MLKYLYHKHFVWFSLHHIDKAQRLSFVCLFFSWHGLNFVVSLFAFKLCTSVAFSFYFAFPAVCLLTRGTWEVSLACRESGLLRLSFYLSDCLKWLVSNLTSFMNDKKSVFMRSHSCILSWKLQISTFSLEFVYAIEFSASVGTNLLSNARSSTFHEFSFLFQSFDYF